MDPQRPFLRRRNAPPHPCVQMCVLSLRHWGTKSNFRKTKVGDLLWIMKVWSSIEHMLCGWPISLQFLFRRTSWR